MKVIPIRKSLWIILPILLIVLFLANISLGSVHIPVVDICRVLAGFDASESIWREIILDFRLTKALTCILAGAALSVGGLQMQTLFRNPLAGPDVFGLSSGASLAVSLVFMSSSVGITLFSTSGPWVVALAASVGSGAVSILILSIAGRVRDNVSLLIIGLMVGAGTSSIVSVLQYASRAELQQSFLIWTFGNVGGLNWGEITILGAISSGGCIVGLFFIKSMNVWLLGDNYAQSLGVNLKRSRLFIIISTSVLTGGVTAFCGPIAFVGLAVPHLTKIIVKTNDHKILIPAVMMVGASLMLLCDMLAQLPGQGQVVPINAITALVGAPVVIWVIMNGKKISV